eukprot:4916253-Prymnesium_polylepis.1
MISEQNDFRATETVLGCGYRTIIAVEAVTGLRPCASTHKQSLFRAQGLESFAPRPRAVLSEPTLHTRRH